MFVVRASIIGLIHHRAHGEHREIMKNFLLFRTNMRTVRRYYSPLSRFLCALCVLCGTISAQNFKTVHDGVEYAQVEHKLGSDPVKINLLRLDLKKVRLDVHHALDKAIGLETTSSIAKRKGAVAAINAGFFRLDKSEFAGDAAGVLMIDSVLVSESVNNRIALAISNGRKNSEIEIGHLRAGYVAGFGTDSEFTFDGVNRERKSNEIILFTPGFSRDTMTDSKGTEIILTNCKAEEFRWWCTTAKINRDQGKSLIPHDGLVVSIGNEAIDRSNNILYFAEGASLAHRSFENTFRIVRRIESVEPGESGTPVSAEDITNGVSRLLKNSRVDITWQDEKASRSFSETRHPRTAVAKLKDGKSLMMTVDGRQPGVSVGMSLQELAEYLLSLGAVDAMNLDGGGSTTMFLDGKVVNTPSDKTGERKVGDAILVTLRQGPGKKR